jgi:hypothetical protein
MALNRTPSTGAAAPVAGRGAVAEYHLGSGFNGLSLPLATCRAHLDVRSSLLAVSP